MHESRGVTKNQIKGLKLFSMPETIIVGSRSRPVANAGAHFYGLWGGDGLRLHGLDDLLAWSGVGTKSSSRGLNLARIGGWSRTDDNARAARNGADDGTGRRGLGGGASSRLLSRLDWLGLNSTRLHDMRLRGRGSCRGFGHYLNSSSRFRVLYTLLCIDFSCDEECG